MAGQRIRDERHDGREHRHGERDTVVRAPEQDEAADVGDFAVAVLRDALEEGVLPGEVLDDAHATEQLLQEPGAPVGPFHALEADLEELAHGVRL